MLAACGRDTGEIDRAVCDEERVLDLQREPQRLLAELLGPLDVPGTRLDAAQVRELAPDRAPVP